MADDADRSGAGKNQGAAWDEPVLGSRRAAADDSPEPAVAKKIEKLLTAERYAVLCTQGQGQPYGSMVAFAASSGLGAIVFATPTTTRKYRLLAECAHVAMVVDNRSSGIRDFMAIEAVTATGRATRVETPSDFETWASLLIDRHHYLRSFVHSSSCALFRVDVLRYLHVVRFQEVRQWVPAPG